MPWAGFGIDGYKLARTRSIEGSKLSAVDGAGGIRACRASRGRDETGTIVVLKISVLVDGRGDGERRTGTDHHERAQTEQIRQGHAAAQEEPLPDVERSATVVLADVVGVRGKVGDTRRVAVGIAQRVEAEELDFGANFYVGVHDQLFLFEIAFGDKAVDIPATDGRTIRVAGGSRIRRIRVDGKELVEAARVQVRRRNSG